MDDHREDEIVGSLYGTEHFENSGQLSDGGTSNETGFGSIGFLIKAGVIILAIIAFAIYSKAEDARQEEARRKMWYEFYKGYSSKDWERSRYNPDGSLKPNYSYQSDSSTTTRSSSDTPRRSQTYKKSTTQDPDEFNVKDYRDPEDFYDDHYDDFFDYEDAEDYYYEHGGF